jgi:hypothetical protein
MGTNRPDAFKECVGLVSLVEDEIRDEERAYYALRLAARVVRPTARGLTAGWRWWGKIG